MDVGIVDNGTNTIGNGKQKGMFEGLSMFDNNEKKNEGGGVV